MRGRQREREGGTDEEREGGNMRIQTHPSVSSLGALGFI